MDRLHLEGRGRGEDDNGEGRLSKSSGILGGMEVKYLGTLGGRGEER